LFTSFRSEKHFTSSYETY